MSTSGLRAGETSNGREESREGRFAVCTLFQTGQEVEPQSEERVPEGGARRTEATVEIKPSDPKGKGPLSKDVASNDKATKGPRTAEGHVPNAETAKVLREAREGKNLLHYESLEEMFKDLGI